MDPLQPSHLLCVYAEPLAAGRRVLVVGDCTQDLGARLLELGARLVHVYDPDGERVRRAPPERNVVFRHLRDDELDVRDGAFDLVLVPDVAILPDPTALVARLRRVVDADGAVLVAARNPESWDAPSAPSTPSGAGGAAAPRVIDYYELYDIVSLQFACVRMIGQVPFFGAAIAELGESEDEPDVSVHTELVTEGEPPEYFIALASHSDSIRLAPYAIVQLPRDAVSLSLGSTQEGVGAADRAVLVEATARVNALEAELDEHRTELARLGAEAANAQRLPDLEQALFDAQNRIQLLEVDIDRRREHAVALEEAVRLAEDAVSILENRTREAEESSLVRAQQSVSVLAEVESLKAALAAERAARESDRAALATERAGRESDRAAFAAERAAHEQRALLDSEEVDRLLLQIGEHEEKNTLLEREFSQMAEAHTTELEALEGRLVERGHRIAELERELGRRERITLSLVTELEERVASETSGRDLGPGEPEIAGRDLGSGGPETSGDVGERTSAGAGETLQREDAELLAKMEVLVQEKDVLAKENAAWSAKLDEMAIDAARREGELHARTWRIAELQGELTRTTYRSIDLERLARLEDELDILRRAIAQEHEARQRAESGEELMKARAELQRQAVLLEQLSRELDARDRAHAVQDSREAP
ncbi:hypothetical protein [Pendulispora albinea]|uniref:Methyltransferase type 11 domain-containing protein n=1 Tax=Pendulispora albinea TaxID=2741071 RepID=A0ABZ2LN91_9BACT